MKVEIWSGFWGPRDCILNPEILFVYGDNDLSFGKRGQACIRDCVNAHGIPTKRAPDNSRDAFYSDQYYSHCCGQIERAIREILKANYEKIVFPRDGLGTGLADLPRKAPKVYAYLTGRLLVVFGVATDNQGKLKVIEK